MIKLKLKEVLQERGINHPHAWLKNVLSINSTTSTSLLSGKKAGILFEHLDTICQKLDCTPNDLMFYEQDGRQTPIPPEHALHQLTKPDTITDWQKLLRKMPAKKVAELSKQINKDFDG